MDPLRRSVEREPPGDPSGTLQLWRRRHIARFSIIGGVLVVALVIEMLILNHGTGGVRGWWVGAALVGGPALLLLLAAVISWKTLLRGRSRELMETATPSQVQRVTKALRRHEPLPGETWPVAQAVVNATANASRRRRSSLVLVVASVLFLANFFLQDGAARWFYLAGAAGYVALALQVRRGSPRLLANAAAQGIHPAASSDPAASGP